MAHQVQAGLPNGSNQAIQLETYPDTCPICHHSLFPQLLIVRARSDVPFSRVDAAFQCTRVTCRHVFVGRYSGNTSSNVPWQLNEVLPATARSTAFSEEISTASPMFVAVFNQAMAAEGMGLDQLVGMGLRKALEFLVKDYAIMKAATDEEKDLIKKKLLGRCIEDHIVDVTVRECAKRATWLANDETHYIRKWETKDITDVKKLVRLTGNAVENALLADHYAKEMPEGR